MHITCLSTKADPALWGRRLAVDWFARVGNHPRGLAVRTHDASETQFIESVNERELVQNELASFSSTAGLIDLRAIEIRANWRERILYWLEVLKTKNVSRDISVDSDFDIKFGTEKIGQIKGSTLTRVVLALHTATIEVYARDRNRTLRCFILDTPRQQDIEREVLIGYLAELRKLAVEWDVQILFSSSNIHYECLEDDKEWTPSFPGVEQKMFLGEVTPSHE